MSLSLPTLHGIQAGIQYLSVSPDESAATMLHLQELSNAFSQATAAAAAESQPASSKPPSPQVTHPPHPSPAATPTGTGAPLHARPGPGPAQPHSLITQAPQSQAQPQNGTQTPSLAQSRQQLPTQPSQAQPALPSSLPPAGQRAVPASAALSVGQRAFPQSAPAPVQAPALPTPSTGGYPPLAPLVIPSVVSGAQKTVKDLEQMGTADAEAIIDAIEELVQDTSHGSATTADSRLTDPVLSKSGQPLMQGAEAVGGNVEVGLQEAVEILNAATKGCGSYAKPILRHITTVADVAKRDGVQAANEALLKLLQIPKAVPQHSLPQQQQQQQLARLANMAVNQPPVAAASVPSKAGAGQQLPSGALQVPQQQQQQQHRPQQQLLHQQHQLQLQQQAQAAQLWQLRQGLANAAAALPSGVSFLQSPGASLGLQPTTASLGPLAAQISAASASGMQAPAQPEDRPLNLSVSLASLPGNIVIPGLPVTAPVLPRTSISADEPSTHRQANRSAN
ncbi:hypothetical protein ABBQ38_014749 [Trebouxia sp. C0009 RCD-2024]